MAFWDQPQKQSKGEKRRSKDKKDLQKSNPSAKIEKIKMFIVSYASEGKKTFFNDIIASPNATDMIKSICNYAVQKQSLSEKQAYCIAVFAVENNIDFNINDRT